MLGIPAEDHHRFHRWSSVIVAATASPNLFRVLPAIWMFVRYIRGMIAAKRASPQDDLISALVQAHEAGDRLRDDELVAMVFLLVVAGHETTVNLIGNDGALALLQFPEQLSRFRDEPALSASAIEELLRFHSPVEVSTERYAREAIEIAGVVIPPGALVYGVLASANRDANEFEEPDRLDLGREKNRHLAFGQGIHYCLGAPLARLEGQVALPRLVERMPALRMAVPESSLRWRPGLNLRGLKELPVAW
jgi:cytochrome P450